MSITVHDKRALVALLGGSRGLGESYARGWWDADDLTGVLRAALRRTRGAIGVLDAMGAALTPVRDPLARRRHRADRQRDRRNIGTHYDLGNDFYAQLLDPGMTYSCAVFEPPHLSLAEAQAVKLDRLCRMLDLRPGDHVLEIGTGWGSFAEHAVTRYGCRVTTTTISTEQHDFATKRIADAGLADRVTVLDDDYRDLDGTYDHVVSIEMVEAVDWREHATYFGAIADRLRPGGRAALQAIVIEPSAYERAKHHDDFIRASIFPGGCLPSVPSISAAATDAGLRVLRLEPIGHHYPATLRAWAERLRRIPDLDPAFRRRWAFYFAYCEAGFLERRVDVVQVLLQR